MHIPGKNGPEIPGYLFEFLCSYTSLTDTQMPVEDFKDHTG